MKIGPNLSLYGRQCPEDTRDAARTFETVADFNSILHQVHNAVDVAIKCFVPGHLGVVYSRELHTVDGAGKLTRNVAMSAFDLDWPERNVGNMNR